MKLPLVTACALALFARAALAATEVQSVVVLPFENLSGSDAALTELAPRIEHELTAKGWKVVGAAEADPLLNKERVRYLDSLPDAIRKSVLDATGAQALVTGTIYRYAEGRNPVVALSARLVRADGTLAWADVASSTAEDTQGLFGFGKKATRASLGETAVADLLRHFPASTGATDVVRGASKPFFQSGPVTATAADIPHVKGEKICILPLENQSPTPDAARIVTDLLSIRLAASGDYTIVEPSVLRAAALEAHIGSFALVRPEALAKLAQLLGTSLFVRGTVFKFVDPSVRYGVEPQLDLDLSLIDVAAGRVVWAAEHTRLGGDYTGLLLLGTINDTVTLADRVVSEIAAAEVKATSRTALSARTAHSNLKRTPEKNSRLNGSKGSEEKQHGDK